ncbi:hypothetical protein [Paenibacillus sp. ACRRY]|uniref:hypothetical protein n=1 Tax=Paenibacillus sp. ACRRY TaxID=2918208 RepID=UPI001EF3F138|nr:hypothetical protein [Paenibacillus sp. ACRRY]MCG7382780.1 hypothetical protein [Paenibacillus sp. ACRRY]
MFVAKGQFLIDYVSSSRPGSQLSKLPNQVFVMPATGVSALGSNRGIIEFQK